MVTSWTFVLAYLGIAVALFTLLIFTLVLILCYTSLSYAFKTSVWHNFTKSLSLFFKVVMHPSSFRKEMRRRQGYEHLVSQIPKKSLPKILQRDTGGARPSAPRRRD